jgi:hypothetical protein
MHRSCRLRALTAEGQAKLTDALNVRAVLTSQDDALRDFADCVHEPGM